jgi:hypothetical protein
MLLQADAMMEAKCYNDILAWLSVAGNTPGSAMD